MININDSKYQDKLEVTPENILQIIPAYNIYRNYIGEFTIGRRFKSPIRSKDDNPSFGIFWSKKAEGKLLFKDLAQGIVGDCFILVKEMFSISYRDTLLKIIFDFRVNDQFAVPDKVSITKQTIKPITIATSNIPKQSDVIIDIRIREWRDYDLKFWEKYGITKKTLELFNVYPIDYIFLNDEIIKADYHSYAYHEQKDGIDRYKIYQPYSKIMKWLSNFIEGTLSGWSQMPNEGKSLIITSSYKDVMTLFTIGFTAISPQTETYTFKKHIIQQLENRFQNIYIYYDYDEAGIKYAKLNEEKYGFIPLFTNSINEKDPSDFYEKYGSNKLFRTCTDRRI